MKKQEKTIIKSSLIATSLLLFAFIPNVKAQQDTPLVGNISISGITMNAGEEKTLTIKLNPVTSIIQSADGIITSKDEACVEIVNVTSPLGSGNMFANVGFSGSITEGGTVTIKGLKNCQTTLKISNAKVGAGDGSNIESRNLEFESGMIIVKDNTSQTQGISSNSSTTTTTTNVSSNTAKTTEVKQVDYATSTNASNNTSVVENSVQNTVNNESIAVNDNNEKKKEYNTDNYLLNITPSVGILSPAFDMKKEKYIIYVPYEVGKITFETELSNKETSKVEIDGNEELSVGENKFIFKVTAESGDIKEYVVTVKKFSNYELSSSNNNLKELTLKNNTLLNSLGQEIKFDKDTLVYYYKKGDDLSYSYVVEDESAAVRTFENGDTISIIVEAENGDIKIYNLLPYEEKKEEENKQSSLKYVLLFILGIFIGYLTKLSLVLIKRYRKQKKKLKKDNQI